MDNVERILISLLAIVVFAFIILAYPYSVPDECLVKDGADGNISEISPTRIINIENPLLDVNPGTGNAGVNTGLGYGIDSETGMAYPAFP